MPDASIGAKTKERQSHMWNNKQKVIWTELLKFNPTAEHLAVWDRKIKIALKFSEYLDGLTIEGLTPLWQLGNKQKKTGKAADSVESPALLKSVWRQAMDFTPTPWHLPLLQAQIVKDLDIDGYFKKTTIETLLGIVREVAQAPAKAAPSTPAQPTLNIGEAK
jgi:hypothetical protein